MNEQMERPMRPRQQRILWPILPILWNKKYCYRTDCKKAISIKHYSLVHFWWARLSYALISEYRSRGRCWDAVIFAGSWSTDHTAAFLPTANHRLYSLTNWNSELEATVSRPRTDGWLAVDKKRRGGQPSYRLRPALYPISGVTGVLWRRWWL